MSKSTATELSRLIQTLHEERRQHADAIAAIDTAFSSLGIAPKTAARRGRPSGKAAAVENAPVTRRRRRRKSKDGMTGEEFLQSILGSGKLTTAAINAKWKESGRKGAANNLLGKLVKDGKVKRATVKGERGSVYSAN